MCFEFSQRHVLGSETRAPRSVGQREKFSAQRHPGFASTLQSNKTAFGTRSPAEFEQLIVSFDAARIFERIETRTGDVGSTIFGRIVIYVRLLLNGLSQGGVHGG